MDATLLDLLKQLSILYWAGDGFFDPGNGFLAVAPNVDSAVDFLLMKLLFTYESTKEIRFLIGLIYQLNRAPLGIDHAILPGELFVGALVIREWSTAVTRPLSRFD